MWAKVIRGVLAAPSHMARAASIPQLRRLPLVVFGLFVLALAGAGVALARSMRAGAERRGEAELVAVAELKLEDLAEYRAGVVEHAALAASYPTLRKIVDEASAGKVDRALGRHGLELVAALAERYGLARIALVGGDGRIVIEHLQAGANAAGPFDPAFVARAVSSGAAASALTARTDEGRARIDAVVPIASEEGRVVGAVAVRADMTRFLVRLTGRWPVPSTTRLAVLARRDGDAAVFITDPVSRRGWALRTRIPLSELRRGIVQAVLAPDRLIHAEDYLGHRLLMSARRVPDSDWVLFTRMEMAEVEAPILGPAKAIGAILGFVMLAASVALAFWWRRELAQHRELDTARQELAASEERFRLALEGSLHVWDWDVAGRRLRSDPRWAQVLGCPEVLEGDVDEILARVVHPDDLPDVSARFRAMISGTAPDVDSEHRAIGSDGVVRWLRLRGRPSARSADGRVLRATGVLADVTRERELKAQLARSERMASLGTLAAGVAHEVNNPLSYVFEALETLAHALPDVAPERTDLADAAAHARDGVERVRDVVRGLRAFSRPGGATRGPVDVADELRAALRLAAHEIRHRAKLVVNVGPMPRVETGEHELGQLFLNLLLNAAQALPDEPAATSRIEVAAGTDAAGWARIEVRDSGVGIPPEVLPRIFEPFFTKKAARAGTGLGLAIAQGVAAEAGGRIEVESQLGRGSTFRVLLPPAAPGPAEAVAPTSTATGRVAAAGEPSAVEPGAAEPGERTAAPRVLVVDDEPLVARAVGRALRAVADVHLVGSGEEALGRLARGERFDALVCDLMMPGMSGMELYARISEQDPSLAGRFVFVTGGAVTAHARAFLAARPDRCIEKPFETDALRAAVERALRCEP